MLVAFIGSSLLRVFFMITVTATWAMDKWGTKKMSALSRKQVWIRELFSNKQMKHFTIVCMLIVLPINIVYLPLFAVNYLTRGTEESVERVITGADYKSFRDIYSYYLFVRLDKDMPYQVEVSRVNYYRYLHGRSTKIRLNLQKGGLGFCITKSYQMLRREEEKKTEKPVIHTLKENVVVK